MAQEPEARGFREHHVALLTRTEGIVLKSAVYGEADLIVTYLTRDCGLIKVFAKSPRKIKSRFGSSLEPLTYSRISFIGKEDAGLPRLTQSDIITPFQAIREDYACFIRLAEILELMINFLPEKELNVDMFMLLLNMLLKLQPGTRNDLHFLFCKIRFLQLAGYLPKLDVCGQCGAKPAKNGANRFFASQGTLMCPSCRKDCTGAVSVSGSSLKFYESLAQWRFETIDRVKAPESLISEITALMDSHLRYILARPLKSDAFAGID
ncbi:MAG TPA: DNA repair protein RecO [Dissulfurispiraceae bacterium]|nr:DNA repair protein RecO [Dissulfurispiraceae bacterium]